MNDLKPFLTESSVLQSLNLYDNKLGVEGARVLAEALSLNSSLQNLDIGCNRIRNKGMKAISEGLYGENSKSNLRVLVVKNNFINEKGFKTFV